MQRVGYSVSEFSEAINVSMPALYKWMALGRLRYVQLGERMRRIPASELKRLGFEGDAT